MRNVEFAAAVKKVFDACRNLSEVSGKLRPFTPDGRMVGDIGEVAAANLYQVSLHNIGRSHWDGVCGERHMQIKATSGNDTYLKEAPKEGFADGLLMVFKIDRNSGDCECVYNGDIQRVWDYLENKKLDRTGAKQITLDRLKELQASVPRKDMIPLR